jgi:tetratricopeptide (TPR) repeat protein
MVTTVFRATATTAWMLLLTFTASAALAQPPASNPLLKEADQLATDGKFADALAQYRKAVAADATFVDAHLGAGRMLDLTGRHAEARKHFATAIELAPADVKPQALSAMGVSYAFQSKARDAASFYEKVFNERIAHGNANGAAGTANAIARVYLESGDLANAERWYRTGYETSKKITDLTPVQADLWQMRWLHAQSRIAARRGNAAEAQRHADAVKALVDKPANEAERAQHHYLLGYIALEAKQYDTAIVELQKANLDDSFVLGLIARAYEKKGDASKAREYYQKVMAATGHSVNTAFAHQWARKYLKA